MDRSRGSRRGFVLRGNPGGRRFRRWFVARDRNLHERFAAVRGIKFARNYGKSAALYCGFAEARGEVVFTMDADLQDSPDEIPALRRMVLDEGYDLVSGWKKKRHDPAGKRWPSKFSTGRPAPFRESGCMISIAD